MSSASLFQNSGPEIFTEKCPPICVKMFRNNVILLPSIMMVHLSSVLEI